MKKGILSLAIASLAICAFATNYTDGVFIVNEDWFGHNASSVNFYSFTDGEMVYRAFQKENPGRTLGNTTQYANSDANNIYFCSKQNYGETGGRFDVVDAKTLQSKLSIAQFSESGDTRACYPFSDTKVYVGTTKGVYVVNPTTGETSGPIAGTSVKEPGAMELAGDKLIVCAQSKGVYVIDTTTDQLEKTVDVSTSTCALFKVNDEIWVSVNNCTWGTPSANNTEQFIKLDASTFEPEEPTTVPMACQNPAWAWKQTAPAIDEANKVLYYAPADGGKFISKYDMNTGEFTQEFISLPDGEQMYGNVIGFDAGYGKIVVETFEGYSSQNYHLHIYNTLGEEESNMTLDANYWFPAMVMFAPKSVTPTDVADIQGAKVVKSQIYYNAAGQSSATPFSGLNIVVTEYTDGSHNAIKQMMK